MKRRILAAIAASAVAVGAMGGVADAKITTSCSTNGGNQPPGQQDTCTGQGLTQDPYTNPAGHQPPGWN